MGSEATEEKESLKKQFSSAFSGASPKMANQFLEVLVGEKPMYYMAPPGGDGIKINDKKLNSAIKEKGLTVAIVPHVERGNLNQKAYLFGKPENVKAMVELGKNPLIGKDEYGFEEEFWEFIYPSNFKVTPEWNRQLGILLGYGEANAEA